MLARDQFVTRYLRLLLISIPTLTLGFVIGCRQRQEDPVAPLLAAPPSVPNIPDERTRWVYEKGWFAKGVSDLWYEHNEEAIRIRGKAWEFRQTNSTSEYVELYDASRGVSLRLGESSAEARWDKEGNDAAWKPLLSGKWDSRK